jgi:rfaE bifunctional protein kinase chain/domain
MNFTDVIERRFTERTILIVGDLVADQFLRGTISRVSREAPVFILRHDETETLAGGAANAAANIASLRAKAVLVGVAGRDANGDALISRLEASNVDCSLVVRSDKFRTTTKVRVLAGQHFAARQQVIRIDYENSEFLPQEVSAAILANLEAAARSADAVILSDYNYGVAAPEVAMAAARICSSRGVPLVIDSRFRLAEFSGATSATPNQDEVEQILGPDFTDEDCVRLRARLGVRALLVTRGSNGMLLVEEGAKPCPLEAVGPKEPVDVTGAGDTVIAVYALGLACGLDFAASACLANHAGGIVVMKKGTATVLPSELLASVADASAVAAIPAK